MHHHVEAKADMGARAAKLDRKVAAKKAEIDAHNEKKRLRAQEDELELAEDEEEEEFDSAYWEQWSYGLIDGTTA